MLKKSLSGYPGLADVHILWLVISGERKKALVMTKRERAAFEAERTFRRTPINFYLQRCTVLMVHRGKILWLPRLRTLCFLLFEFWDSHLSTPTHGGIYIRCYRDTLHTPCIQHRKGALLKLIKNIFLEWPKWQEMYSKESFYLRYFLRINIFSKNSSET